MTHPNVCAAARELNRQMRSVWRDAGGPEIFFYCECGCFERRSRPSMVALTSAAYDDLDGEPVLAPGHIRIATTW